MDERNNHFDFDFTPIGQAIKKAREARGMTREQLSGIIGYAPRHIQSIENEGQYPSIELFIQLITMFDVSVDEYIFPNKEVEKMDCQHFFRQIFLGYFSDIVQAFDTLRKNVCGDDYTSLHNPIVLSSVLPAYGMFHSIQILFL